MTIYFQIKQELLFVIKKGISFFYELYRIKNDLKKNTSFNNNILDKRIETFALKLRLNKKTFKSKTNNNNIAFFATELYDYGGHGVLLRNILQNIPCKKNVKLFLTKKNRTLKLAKNRIKEIERYAKIDGINFSFINEKKNVIRMFDKIVKFSPKVIFTFIHMNDSFAVAVLALLKKYTDIKILFVNHGAHHPCLGISFANLILETSPYNSFITQKYRHFANTYIIWLVGENKENLPSFNEKQIENMKLKIGVPKNYVCSMTGCASYKLYYKNKSVFLEIIYSLLKKHKNLCHVLITNLTPELKQIIDLIFIDLSVKNRLIILDFFADYKLVFKCADVFIDSFPISNDLTTVDLMSLKVPFVSMINKENVAQSFNEFMPRNYPYSFYNVKDFECGIEKLLFNKKEQEKVAEINYEHFLTIFEGKKATENILNLIDCDDFSKIYDKINEEEYKNYKNPQLISII